MFKSAKAFIVLLAILTLSSSILYAQSFEATVGTVINGDTLVVNKTGRQMTVKLFGIAAPLLSQSYGQQAKEFLAQSVLNKKVTIEPKGQDKDAMSAVVSGFINMRKETINEYMVKLGLAWADTRNNSNLYVQKQQLAQNKRLGLWADPNPMSPWEYQSYLKEQKNEEARKVQREQKALKDEEERAKVRQQAALAAQLATEEKRKSAEQGNPEAQYNLAVCYFNGEGVTRDEAEAMRWFLKAAEQGNVNAKMFLDAEKAKQTAAEEARQAENIRQAEQARQAKARQDAECDYIIKGTEADFSTAHPCIKDSLFNIRKRENEVSVEECNSIAFKQKILTSFAIQLVFKCSADIDCCEIANRAIKKFPLADYQKKIFIDEIERIVNKHNKYGINQGGAAKNTEKKDACFADCLERLDARCQQECRINKYEYSPSCYNICIDKYCDQ